MAAEGLRFTDGYANSLGLLADALCAHDRALAIPAARRRDEPHGHAHARQPDLGLPPEHPTLPSLLAAAGYATALAGKWHLGFPPHFGPLKSGYQEFFGVDERRRRLLHPLRFGRASTTSGEDETEVDQAGYLTDLISERAVDLHRPAAQADRPFLLSLHYTAPHWPWETRDDEAAREIASKSSSTPTAARSRPT